MSLTTIKMIKKSKTNQRLNKLLRMIAPFLKKSNPDRLKHSLRVLKIAEYIAQQEKADTEVVQFAALLHDIGKYKDAGHRTKLKKQKNHPHKNHAEFSVEISASVLNSFKLTKQKKKDIFYAIKNHGSFIAAETIEARIIQDADRLDRLSPVRVANLFYYGGNYYGSKECKSFPQLATKIINTLNETTACNTRAARKLAKKKLKLCLDFMNEFKNDYVEEPCLKIPSNLKSSKFN